MRIQLNETYFIEKDDYCFTLKQFTGQYNKKGEEVHKYYGYYNSLEGALLKYTEEVTSDILGRKETVTIHKYISTLREQSEKTRKMLREIR